MRHTTYSPHFHWLDVRGLSVDPHDLILFDECTQSLRRCDIRSVEVNKRLPMLLREFSRPFRSTGKRRLNSEDRGAIRIDYVLLSSFHERGGSHLLQIVSAWDCAVLRKPFFRTPSTVRNAAADRPIESGAISSGLAA